MKKFIKVNNFSNLAYLQICLILVSSLLLSTNHRLEASTQVLKSIKAKLNVKKRPEFPKPKEDSVTITLKKMSGSGKLPVSFGLPFPPDTLSNKNKLYVKDDKGKIIPIYTKVLCNWHIDKKKGDIRSVLIQFNLKFTGKTKKVTVHWGDRPKVSQENAEGIEELLDPPAIPKGKSISISKTQFKKSVRPRGKATPYSFQCPKVLALIPPEWLCQSLIVWQQVSKKDNKKAKWYDTHLTKEFPGSLDFISSRHYGDYLFDRTANYVKIYVRHGKEEHLLAALKAGEVYMQNQRGDGFFKLKKGNDHKYVYTEGSALLYMLTGDERFKKAVDKALKAWKSHTAIAYPGRGFWTERHHGFGMLAHIHAYEITGKSSHISAAKKFFDAAYSMQVKPKNGKKANGAWMHSTQSHGERGRGWITSPWMSAFLVDGIWKYWMITGDKDAPKSLAMYAKFTSNHAVTGNRVYYLASSPGHGSSSNPERAHHNMEAAYILAIGYYLSGGKDSKMNSQIKALYPPMMKDPANSPGRKFNWRFRETSMLIWMLENA